jgi:hypothetical protein
MRVKDVVTIEALKSQILTCLASESSEDLVLLICQFLVSFAFLFFSLTICCRIIYLGIYLGCYSFCYCYCGVIPSSKMVGILAILVIGDMEHITFNTYKLKIFIFGIILSTRKVEQHAMNTQKYSFCSRHL